MAIRPSPRTGLEPDSPKPKIPDAQDKAASDPPNNSEYAEPSLNIDSHNSDEFVLDAERDAAARRGIARPIPSDVSSALTYGLELVRYGAMLVAVEGQPQIVNRPALAILEKKDGLWLSKTGLVAQRASDTRILLKLFHEAINTPEKGEPSESPLLLPRATARTALIVRVIPGPGLECWPGTGGRAAMMMLYDQDMGVEVNISLLIKLYGLTRGEAALAASLMRGKTIEEAAEELFISPHTARTHLKRIFMKTDTHRQTELVVRTLPAVL